MNKIFFFEGVPGVGKTTLARKMMASGELADRFTLVQSAEVVPENPVRKAVKDGRMLSVSEARAIYREKPYADYRDEHLRIWTEFSRRYQHRCMNVLVDAGLIQAPLYELMGLYMLSQEQILQHLQDVVDLISYAFEPHLIYIRTVHPGLCIRKAMKNQKNEREQWVKGFCRWLEVAPYPMKKGYAGLTGIERFIEDRYEMDCYLLDQLQIHKTIRNRGQI